MHDPTMRVFTVLEVLQSREWVAGEELSSCLGVSSRTVQRYILRLRDLGMAIESRPGVGGAYRLGRGRKIPPLVVGNGEALALTLGLRALEKLGLEGFKPAIESASMKLTRLLPDTVSARVRKLNLAIEIGSSQGPMRAPIQVIANASSAVKSGRRIRFGYAPRGQSDYEVREVDPYSVLFFNDRWYVIGFCHRRQETRSFRLDRLSDLRVLAQTFERPKEFRPLSFMQESLDLMDRRGTTKHASKSGTRPTQ